MTTDFSSFILGLLLVTIVTLPFCAGVECYVCSWGPYDNQSDSCTRANFDHSRMRTHDCPLGCEAIAIYNKNDDLEMFYRNCLKRGSPITNDCRRETTKSFTEEICTCDVDRCNSAGRPWKHFRWMLVPAAILLASYIS